MPKIKKMSFVYFKEGLGGGCCVNLAPFLSADHSSPHFLGVDSIWAEASSGCSTPRGDFVHSAGGLALTSQRPASPPPQCNVRSARASARPRLPWLGAPFTTRVLVFQSSEDAALCCRRQFSLLLPLLAHVNEERERSGELAR